MTARARQGDPQWLERAARVSLRLAGVEQHRLRPLLALLVAPGDLLGWVRFVGGLPWARLVLDDSIAAVRFDLRLFETGGRLTWVRLAQSVLDVADEERHLRGRSRQALRTNVRRARAAGLVCGEAIGSAELDELDRAVQSRWASQPEPHGPYAPLFGRPGQLTVAVRDPGGAPLAVAAATIVGDWAHLDLFVKLADPGEARFLLHVFLLERLRERRVRRLVTTPLLRLSPGLRYLHGLLGYAPTNLVVRRPSRGARRRALAAVASSAPAPRRRSAR